MTSSWRWPPTLDTQWWTRPDLADALNARDIGAVYRFLNARGFSQRHIATITGQQQTEVHDIIHGRRTVRDYDILLRIATTLRIPPALMGLSHGCDACRHTPGQPHQDVPEPAGEPPRTAYEFGRLFGVHQDTVVRALTAGAARHAADPDRHPAPPQPVNPGAAHLRYDVADMTAWWPHRPRGNTVRHDR